MCRDCGCNLSEHTHPVAHTHAPTRKIEIERRILSANDQRAEHNRRWLTERGVLALNIIASPGAGKTTLLEATLKSLSGRLQCAVIAGDQQTHNDADRLSGKGAPVCQILTGNACHLEARQIAERLPSLVKPGVDLLLIENVGNLVCPAAFDLGEHHKIALLSVTEGEDKPIKYPALFSVSSVVVLTKIDLVAHLTWNRQECIRNIRHVRADASIFELSAKTGDGLADWLDFLCNAVGRR